MCVQSRKIGNLNYLLKDLGSSKATNLDRISKIVLCYLFPREMHLITLFRNCEFQ